MPSQVRPSMSELITRTRLLIGDPSGTSPVFRDDQIQDWLDETREDVRYEALRPQPTYTPTGVQWNDYYAQVGHWESGVTLIWANYTTLTPSTSDLIVGHWTFSNQLPPILAAGQRYDVWGVAANLLEMRIAQRVALDFDFSADGRNMRLGTTLDRMQALAKQYRQRARPRMLRIQRADLDFSANQQQQQNRPDVGPVSAGVPFLTGP